MAIIGDVVVYIIMAFVVAGAIAAIRDDEHGMGKEFKEGLHAIGPIFIPVAGIMASIPYLSQFIKAVVGPVFGMEVAIRRDAARSEGPNRRVVCSASTGAGWPL